MRLYFPEDWKLKEWKQQKLCQLWTCSIQRGVQSIYCFCSLKLSLPPVFVCPPPSSSLHSSAVPLFNFRVKSWHIRIRKIQVVFWMPESDLKNTDRLQYSEWILYISFNDGRVLALQCYANHTNMFSTCIEWILTICILIRAGSYANKERHSTLSRHSEECWTLFSRP